MRKERDFEDFDEAFDRLLGRAFRHAQRMVGDPALAEDLAAEALARTYAHWRRVRDYEHLDAWVLRVVTNLAIDAYAKRRVVPADATPMSPEEAAVLRVTLAQALRSLPARQRDAVVLRYLVDMSEADVAASLGVAPGTVKAHLHRAVAHLRRTLGPTFDPHLEEV
jgi:RNA polymerase sigma-70 factor (ECF subfamily)